MLVLFCLSMYMCWCCFVSLCICAGVVLSIYVFVLVLFCLSTSNAEMDWDNEQICHWLTAVGLGDYVQVFHFSFWLGKEGGPQ